MSSTLSYPLFTFRISLSCWFLITVALSLIFCIHTIVLSLLFCMQFEISLSSNAWRSKMRSFRKYFVLFMQRTSPLSLVISLGVSLVVIIAFPDTFQATSSVSCRGYIFIIKLSENYTPPFISASSFSNSAHGPHRDISNTSGCATFPESLPWIPISNINYTFYCSLCSDIDLHCHMCTCLRLRRPIFVVVFRRSSARKLVIRWWPRKHVWLLLSISRPCVAPVFIRVGRAVVHEIRR